MIHLRDTSTCLTYRYTKALVLLIGILKLMSYLYNKGILNLVLKFL